MIVRRVEFLPMLSSRRRKLPLRVSDNHTYQKSWEIFWGGNSSLAIYGICGSSHVGLLIKKIKESGSGFHVLAIQRNIWSSAVSKLMSITNKAEN